VNGQPPAVFNGNGTSTTFVVDDNSGPLVEMTVTEVTLQCVVHVLPLIVLVCIIGLPIFHIPFLHTTLMAAAIFAVYNVVLAIAGTSAWHVYHVQAHRPGETIAAWTVCIASFLTASTFVECVASDVLSAPLVFGKTN